MAEENSNNSETAVSRMDESIIDDKAEAGEAEAGEAEAGEAGAAEAEAGEAEAGEAEAGEAEAAKAEAGEAEAGEAEASEAEAAKAEAGEAEAAEAEAGEAEEEEVRRGEEESVITAEVVKAPQKNDIEIQHMGIDLLKSSPIVVIKQEPGFESVIEHLNRPSASVGSVRSCKPRNDGYSTEALDPIIFNMLNMFVKQKISKDRPHFCMYCGKQFFNGSGLYIHYYCHQQANNNKSSPVKSVVTKKSPPSVTTGKMKASTKPSKSQPNVKPVAVKGKHVIGTVAKRKSVSAPKSCNIVVNGKTTSKGMVASAMSAITASAATASLIPSEDVIQHMDAPKPKPFPTKLLPAKTMKMIQDLLRKKITPENPHFCNVCHHEFKSGCGIYIHYLKHVKKSPAVMKKEVKKATTFPGVKQAKARKRPRGRAATVTSRNVAVAQAVESVVGQSLSKPVQLDAKTLLMLRDIATRISPEDPHICERCEHPFYNARGIQAHYQKHAKEKLLAASGGASNVKNVKVKSKISKKTLRSTPVPTTTSAAAAATTTTTTTTGVSLKPKGSKKQQISAVDLDAKKPSPLQWLRPAILHMLQGVVKNRISDDNPHTCTFCPKVFLRGTGLYFHYLHHKEAIKSFAGMNVHLTRRTDVQIPPAALSAKNLATPKTHASSKASSSKLSSSKNSSSKTSASTAPKTINAKSSAASQVASNVRSSAPKKAQLHAAKSLSHRNATPASLTSTTDVTTLDTTTANGNGNRKQDSNFLLRQLEHNTKKLLYHLTKDVQVLQSFGWPQKDASSIVDDILAACNVTPMRRTSHYPSRKLQCLRSNVQKLIKFCIRDEVMVAKGWKDKLVDDAVREIIAAEGFSGHDQDRVTF